MGLSVWRSRHVSGDCGATDWVIAADAADARAILTETHGDGWEDADHEPVERPDDELLRITLEDDAPLTLSCAEWVAREGRGFLCSTEE